MSAPEPTPPDELQSLKAGGQLPIPGLGPGRFAGVRGILGRFFNNTVSEAGAYAAGIATGPALEPITRGITNEAWKIHPDFPLGPGEAAGAVAEGHWSEGRGKDEGAKTGHGGEQMDALIHGARRGPGFANAVEAFRRGEMSDGGFTAALEKERIGESWWPALRALRRNVLTATEYAGLHLRGWIDAGAMIAGGAKTGYSPEDMQLMYLNRGRPISPVQFATAYARQDAPEGVGLGYEDFERAVKQSDIRPEWGPAIWASSIHAYPPLFQLSRLVLGGVITPEQGAKWAKYDRYAPEVINALLAYWKKPSTTTAAAKEATASDYAAQYEARFISGADFTSALVGLGYKEHEAAEKLAAVRARVVRSAMSQAMSDIHAEFKKGGVTSAQAAGGLGAIGYDGEQVSRIVSAWEAARNAGA